MDGPEEQFTLDGCQVRLVGTIPGFVPDGERVAKAIQEHAPDAVALGVPDTDLEAMEALVADPTLADGLEPDELDLHFLELIGAWGDTQFLPSPDLHEAHDSGKPMHGIDMPDEMHTEAFTRTVKVRHLVQRSTARKRLAKSDAEGANDPYALARQWDQVLCKVQPLGDLERQREAHMAEGIRALAPDHGRLVVVVHTARFAGVLRLLTDGP